MNKRHKRNNTPIVDFLIENSKNIEANFHTLPLSNIDSKNKIYDKYKELFGCKYLSLESTIAGQLFDSFFYPVRVIKKSQKYASEAFCSNDTLFVTCGTTVANYIAVDAMVNDHSHVLLDREAHQSMHFAINNKKIKFDYYYSEVYCKETERKYIKLNELIMKVRKAKENKKPYDLIILNASSYDGVVSNIYKIIKKIICIDPEINFLIDEAWISAFYFHKDLYKYTAGYAAKKFKGLVNIVSTQSAHKSLMALRQASLIHSFANDEITERLYKSRFKYHTTSPSYPILASIDMARYQMQSCGKSLVSNALKYARMLREKFNNDDSLSVYKLQKNNKNLQEISGGINMEDPLKLHINFKKLGFRGCELQEYLYYNHGIYFNRYTDSSALVNIHIGIDRSHIDSLIDALKSIHQMKKSSEISLVNESDFIISYPPGIPLYAPGEKFSNKVKYNIQDKMSSGVNVFQID